MRPACGSTSVFHTNADSGASAAGWRVSSACAGADALHLAAVRGRRQQVHDRVEDRRARRRSSSDEAGSTGKIRPVPTALRSPFASCSSESVPFSKNSSISSSLLSATISTSFSRQAFAVSACAAGISAAWNLPLASSA